MNLLALDTSCDPGSIALWRAGEIVARDCPAGVANSETLLPLAERTLAEVGLGFGDLAAIAFARGPGSFTGLRIACGVAQGLALARNLPLVAVGTLEAMALASGGSRVIVVLDARMHEVYCGFFIDGAQQGEIAVYPPQTLPLPASSGWLACGNGLAAYPELRQRLAPYVDAWQPELMPSAAAVARIGAQRLAAGEAIDPAEALPLYVRDKVARTVVERLASGGRA